MSNELGERVAKLETRLDNHDKYIANFKENDKALTKLTMLYEMQVETMSTITSTLQNINGNLSKVNNTQEKIQVELSEIGSRVEKVEDKQKANDDANTINLTGLSKKAILWIVGVGLTALTACLLIWLDLK